MFFSPKCPKNRPPVEASTSWDLLVNPASGISRRKLSWVSPFRRHYIPSFVRGPTVPFTGICLADEKKSILTSSKADHRYLAECSRPSLDHPQPSKVRVVEEIHSHQKSTTGWIIGAKVEAGSLALVGLGSFEKKMCPQLPSFGPL
jgi:hypothetical protein